MVLVTTQSGTAASDELGDGPLIRLTGGEPMDNSVTTPPPEVDPRIVRAAEVLRGIPAEPYSESVPAAERAFWCQRAAASIRDLLDLLAEQSDPKWAS
jgi:hypothetical protein